MQFCGAEIGVGGIVLVKRANGRIPEEYAAAAIGLQPVLVRIDDDRVCPVNLIECLTGIGRKFGCNVEVTAIG